MDTAPIVDFFSCADPMQTKGRKHDIEKRYEGDLDDPWYVDNCVEKCKQLIQEKLKGHVLIFLPGQNDIYKAIEGMKREYGQDPKEFAFLPLFASLPDHEKQQALDHSVEIVISIPLS